MKEDIFYAILCVFFVALATPFVYTVMLVSNFGPQLFLFYRG